MFSNCWYVEFEIILMKTFCNWFLQDFSSQVVLKFYLNNEGGWVAKLLKSRVDRVFEKQGKINASFENEIFWKPLFYKSNAPYFLNDFKLKYFEPHFSFEDKGLLPFYLSQTKLVLKMFWNHFLFEKVKLSQSNFVFGNLFLNKTFEARFWRAHFGFAEILERNLALKLKSKAFKTKLCQRFWFKDVLLIEKQNLYFSEVKL
jgi:hypothetical protein